MLAVSTSTLERELSGCKQYLQTNGLFSGIDDFAYPYGEQNTLIQSVVAQYFRSARGITGAWTEGIPADNPYLVRALEIQKDTATTTIQNAITDAANNHEWLVIFTHNILDVPSATTEVQTLKFKAIVDTATSTAASLGLKIVNYHDALAYQYGTNQQLIFANNSNAGVATTSPGSTFSIGGVANFTTATSTFYTTGGINLKAGCFAVAGACITSGSGGSSAWPFTPSTYGGVANQSTTTPLWLKDTAIIASTTYFTNASTTGLTNTGSTWLTGLTNGQLVSTGANGLLTSTSSIGNNQLANSTISGIALGSNLAAHTVSGTLSGSSYNGSAVISDWAVNLGNANTWTAIQKQSNTGTTTFSGGIEATNIGTQFIWATSTSKASTFNFASTTVATIGTLFLTNPLSVANGGTGAATLTGCLTGNGTGAITGSGTCYTGTGANPTASITLSTQNGVAATFMRSDGAPPLDQTIAPTMSGLWKFSNTGTTTVSGGMEVGTKLGAPYFIATSTSATSFFNGSILVLNGPNLMGTSTPSAGLFTLGTSTTPQLMLSDNTAADSLWAFRNISGNLFLATSTATATSTNAALQINGNSTPSLSVGTTTAVGILNLGSQQSSNSTSTIMMGKIQFDGYNAAGTHTCVMLIGTAFVAVAGACTP